MRRENQVLSRGDLKFLMADDNKMVLCYSRSDKENEIISVFNRSATEQDVTIPVHKSNNYIEIFTCGGIIWNPDPEGVHLVMKPLSALVLRKVN
jgi:hypothetical protein